MRNAVVATMILAAALAWPGAARAGALHLDLDLRVDRDRFHAGGRLLDGWRSWGARLDGRVRPDGLSLDGRVEGDGRGFEFRLDADVLGRPPAPPPGRLDL
jgi:hypothetical protein